MLMTFLGFPVDKGTALADLFRAAVRDGYLRSIPKELKLSMTVLDDYETMSSKRRDLEDAERGYSIGRFGGEITRIDHRSPPREKPSGKYSDAPKVLQGFACLYNVIHSHKGRKEMFATNCFEGSLFSVMCHVDHNLLSKQLGDQDDGSLELFDSEIGLAFCLKISASDLDRLQGRDQMSVMYRENVVDFQSIGSDSVRVIKSASLVEVSAVSCWGRQKHICRCA